jgi:pre-rRNA-processing protein TSR4
MSWRAGHKIACQQIKVSSPLCGPNKNGTTSPESCKGHGGLNFSVLQGLFASC